MSENDYLKEIPLSEFAVDAPDAFVDGPFGSNLKSAEYTDEGVRLIQLQNIGVGQWLDFNKKFVSKRKLATLARHAVRAGDIAIAKMAEPVARACVVPPVADDFMVVADCIKLRVDEAKADPRFVVYLLNSYNFRTQAERKSIGTTRIRINLSVLKNLEIAVPSLVVQHRIAEILDTADEAIQSTERLIAKLEQAKQGLLHDLLTCGIDDNGRLRDAHRASEKFVETPLGRRPSEWQLRTLGELARYLNGYAFAPEDWVETGYPIIRIQNLNGSTDFNYYAGPTHPDWRVEHGDLLFAWSGTRESSFGPAIWRGSEAVLNQHIFKVCEDNSLVMRHFLYMLLEYNLERIAASAHGFKSSFVHVKRTELTSVMVAVPPIDEQQRILRVSESEDLLIAAESLMLDRLRLLKVGLMDDLLTGRVRVGGLA